MQRAARFIQNGKHSREILSDDDIACAVWPAAVGKAIAEHTSNVRLVRETVVADVEDAIWQRQLHALRFQIVERMRKLTGSARVTDAEFRIGVPRKQPQRAASRDSAPAATGDPAQDEAERIEDPLLQKLYRRSRKRASA